MPQIHSLFQGLKISEPSAMLRMRVLARIEKEESMTLARRQKLSVAGVCISLAVLLFGGIQYGEELLQSDFWTLVSLLFSDLGVIMNSFQDFVYSLLETLPVVPFFAFLAPLALFFWSVSVFLSLSKKGQSRQYHGTMLAHL